MTDDRNLAHKDNDFLYIMRRGQAANFFLAPLRLSVRILFQIPQHKHHHLEAHRLTDVSDDSGIIRIVADDALFDHKHFIVPFHTAKIRGPHTTNGAEPTKI